MRKQKLKPTKKNRASKTIMRRKDYQALAAFRYTLRKFFRFSEEAASGFGLSMRQYQALLTIRGFPEHGTVTVGDIAEWLQIRHHSAVGLVDRLQARRLVVRRRSSEDKRRVFISLTPMGNRVLERLAAMNKEELKRLRPQLEQLSQILH